VAVNKAATLMVGSSEDALGTSHAVCWDTSGRIRDLNDLIDSDSGWFLLEADSIGHSGDIQGIGLLNGELMQFLLVPVR
jgi:hypothetical protein